MPKFSGFLGSIGRSRIFIGVLLLPLSGFAGLGSSALEFESTVQNVAPETPSFTVWFPFSNTGSEPELIQSIENTGLRCEVEYYRGLILPHQGGNVKVQCQGMPIGTFHRTFLVRMSVGQGQITTVELNLRGSVPSQGCVANFKNPKFDLAIQALNRISRHVPTCAAGNEVKETSMEKLKRINLLAIQEQEVEALASYVFMNFLYGRFRGHPLDHANLETARGEVCALLRRGTLDEVAAIQARDRHEGAKLHAVEIAWKSNCGNPDVDQRVNAALALAQKRLLAVGYQPGVWEDLGEFNAAVYALQNSCDPIRNRAEVRAGQRRILWDRLVRERGSAAARDAYGEWLHHENDDDPADLVDFKNVKVVLDKLFGSYYGRLVAASPALMNKLGFYRQFELNSPKVCKALQKMPRTRFLAPEEISNQDIVEALGSFRVTPNEALPSFVDSVRSQLADIAGERIVELSPYNKPGKLREKVAYDFLFSHESSVIQAAIQEDPGLARVICKALSAQSFWEDSRLKDIVSVGKVAGTVFAVAGGFVLAPFTMGSSMGGAVMFVGGLAVGEGVYQTKRNELRTGRIESANSDGELIYEVSKGNANQLLNNAGKIQTFQIRKRELYAAQLKEEKEHFNKHLIIGLTAAGGFVVGKALGVASDVIGADTYAGKFLAHGGQVEIAGVQLGVTDVTDQVVRFMVTGQWDPQGMVMSKMKKRFESEFTAHNDSMTALLKEKFPEWDPSKAPTRRQKLALTQDLFDQMKASAKPGERLPSKTEIYGRVNTGLLGITPEKVSVWIEKEIKGPGSTPESRAAFASFEKNVKKHVPDQKKVEELLGDSYAVFLSGKAAGLSAKAAAKEKLFMTGVFAEQLEAAGVPKKVVAKSIQDLGFLKP